MVFDEANSIRDTIGANIMYGRNPKVVTCLRSLLSRANIIVLAQADLSEDVMCWVAELAWMDLEDRQSTQRCALAPPGPLSLLSISTDILVVPSDMVDYYTATWDEVAGK